MTPAEAVAAIERLVEAGAKASPGEWRVIPKRYEVESVEGMVAGGIGSGDGYFIVAAANARPALSALAGCCVLPVDVVRVLIEAARSDMLMMDAIDRHLDPPLTREAGCLADKIDAALAAAEAEVARATKEESS